MNPRLDQLHPYPFQKLRELFAGTTPNPALTPINLSIGEPRHPTPQFIKDALVAGLGGLANYPVTQGSDALRRAMADWAGRRYGVTLDPATEVLPVNGSREALFAFAQASVDSSHPDRQVIISPNPFYQIYEGAAILAGARPFFINTTPENGFGMDWSCVPEALWEQVNLVYVCSPGNPTGAVFSREALAEVCRRLDVPVVYADAEYDPSVFLRQTAFRERERCGVCYATRLDRAARQARRSGAQAFTSTLLYSRYQDHEAIRAAGEAAGQAHGVPFFHRDFRSGWEEGIRLSREWGLYRQPYCGCIHSEFERYRKKLLRAP